SRHTSCSASGLQNLNLIESPSGVRRAPVEIRSSPTASAERAFAPSNLAILASPQQSGGGH
ncbi:MAG: hypothetical protein WB561_23350, partial [Terracidiphilus sp.]